MFRLRGSWLLILLLAGCATRGGPPPAGANHPPHAFAVWPLEQMAAAEGEAVLLRNAQQGVFVLPVSALRAYASAARRLQSGTVEKANALPVDFAVIEGSSPNAFAIVKPERSVIAVNLGMLKLLGDDEAMWAAVIGHELAHFRHGHQQQRVSRQEFGDAVEGALALLLSFAGVPLAPLLTHGSTALVGQAYSRQDEHEADDTAISLMLDAGYDPSAALRFHERLRDATGDRAGGLLSTHPGGQARVDAIRQRIDALAR